MPTKIHKEIVKNEIKKTQGKRKPLSLKSFAIIQPDGRGRVKPGEGGKGQYYRIVLRPKSEFLTFRYDDVGRKKGELERLAGKRQSGSWDTQAWLVNKNCAHIAGEYLVGDTDAVRKLLYTLATIPKHVKADIFEAKVRRKIRKSLKTNTLNQKTQHVGLVGAAGGKARKRN